MKRKQLADIEIKLFVDALHLWQGYDFSNYAKASLKRRIEDLMRVESCEHISELIPRVLHENDFLYKAMNSLCVHVTEMFRDPEVFLYWREEVVPILKTYPEVNIWVAGCATGEEVYSLAILLKEEGLYERSHIYASDISQSALDRAEEGIYSLNDMKEYSRNYQLAGGKASLADYYHARYDHAIMNESLRENVLFVQHNLTMDHVFCEAHVVSCRNVMIYFNRDLQNKTIKLFNDSLVRGGLLCLGTKESLRFSDSEQEYKVLSKPCSFYQLDHSPTRKKSDV